MAYPTLTLPRNPSFGYSESFDVQTEAIAFHRGHDQVVPGNVTPLRVANLAWKSITESDLHSIQSFFRALKGTRGPFLWTPLNKIDSPTSISPTLSSVAGGALGARTYFVVFTWYDATAGETIESARSSLALAANTFIVVTVPPAPNQVGGWRVYVSETSGAEKLEATITDGSTSWTQSGALAGVNDPPASNTLAPAIPWMISSPINAVRNSPGRYSLNLTFQEQYF